MGKNTIFLTKMLSFKFTSFVLNYNSSNGYLYKISLVIVLATVKEIKMIELYLNIKLTIKTILNLNIKVGHEYFAIDFFVVVVNDTL